MSNTSPRQVTMEMAGKVLVIYVRGGGDCLWLHMYLDIDKWQMTCDSDVGHYSFYWGHQLSRHRDFVEFCIEWLADENWLLRKCVGERHVQRDFLREKAQENLRRMIIEYNEDDENFDVENLDDLIAASTGYDDANAWAMVVSYEAYSHDIQLPEEWYECIEEDYTPMQKRFAEICRETIVPELKRLKEFEKKMIRGEVFKV